MTLGDYSGIEGGACAPRVEDSDFAVSFGGALFSAAQIDRVDDDPDALEMVLYPDSDRGPRLSVNGAEHVVETPVERFRGVVEGIGFDTLGDSVTFRVRKVGDVDGDVSGGSESEGMRAEDFM